MMERKSSCEPLLNEFDDFYKRKRELIQNVDERIQDIICDKYLNMCIPLYIFEIRRSVRNIDSLEKLKEFENNIDDKFNKLEEMVSDYNYYKAKVMKLKDIIGEYAPETLFGYLHEYEKAIMVGKYEKTENIIVRMNVGLRTLKSRKYSVSYSWNIIKENYEKKIANLNEEEKVLANEILEKIKSILIDILKGYEKPEITKKLEQISFESMKEIDSLETYKTRSLYVSKNGFGDEMELVFRVDTDHKSVYCYGGKSNDFQDFKVSSGMLSLKYKRVLDVLSKKNNDYESYLNRLVDFLNISELGEKNRIMLINEVVECMEASRCKYLEKVYNESDLQRKLIKNQGDKNGL